MTSHTIAAPQAGAPEQRYRRAERALWEHHGIEPAERFVDAYGARLRVLEVGTGEPVLFVHGTGGPGTWPSLVAELSGYRCLLLDRPGWGLSAPLDYSRHEYSRLVADLLSEVLGALGLDRAHVVGSSIGNNWALRLAERHPDRVGRVVMLGGGPLVDDVAPPVFIRLLASPLGRVIAALPQRPKMARAQLRGIGHGASLDAGRIPDVFFDWREALTRHTRSMPSERAMVRALVRGRSFRPGLTFGDADLAGIRAPALLVYGTEDPVGTIETWRRFTAALPRGELQLVDGAGHAPWFDDPGRVARELRRFLAAR
jgi:pimeloyl-ACP methyl ester carboxylesterase